MRPLLLALLCWPVVAQPYVLIANCGTDAACTKLQNLVSRISDSPVAARIMSARGLYFGEPNCEAAGVANRRCAWSHNFSLSTEDTAEADSDQTWLLKRADAIAAQFGFTPSQLRARISLRNVASVAPLPADWRYPTDR